MGMAYQSYMRTAVACMAKENHACGQNNMPRLGARTKKVSLRQGKPEPGMPAWQLCNSRLHRHAQAADPLPRAPAWTGAGACQLAAGRLKTRSMAARHLTNRGPHCGMQPSAAGKESGSHTHGMHLAAGQAEQTGGMGRRNEQANTFPRLFIGAAALPQAWHDTSS